MTPGRLSAAALLAALALAGCSGAATTETGNAPAPTTTMAPPAPPVETAAATATMPAPPAPEAAKTYPEPETLRGLDADGLARLLGAPRLKRRDEPAEIWQYRNDSCALDVFLYRAGDIFRVRHFETRGPGLKPVAAKDCFVSLLKARERRAG